MRVSILLFDGFTALDAIGGYAVLTWLPNTEVVFVAETKSVIADDVRRGGFMAYQSLSEITETDILYVPGGPGVEQALKSNAIIDFVKRLHKTSKWTVGICNGVEILGAAGILTDKTVATNFTARDRVAAYGANVVTSRYHRDGDIITSGGVSASIDAMLFLARLIAGEEIAKTIQLGIEYYPSPPFSYASPDDVPGDIQDLIRFAEANTVKERMKSAEVPFPQILI